MVLTADESNALEAAKREGFLVRSGHRIGVLCAFRRWCAEQGRPYLVIRRGARESVLMLDDRDTFKGELDEVESKAVEMAANGRSLFEGAA